jgi:hypothetical protein
MRYNTVATIHRTHAGTSRVPSITYDNDMVPTSFRHVAYIAVMVASSNMVTWTWHEEAKSTGGVVLVTCSYRGATMTGSARFVVDPR